MKRKSFEPGDSVRVKCTVQVHGKDSVVYIDGKLHESNKDNCDWWLVEYQLNPEFNAPKYTNWWRKEDITSKHYLATTDEDYFKKAEKIVASNYTGMVYYDDQYFESVAEFLGYLDWESLDIPTFVWAVEAKPVKLNLDLINYVSESIEDNGYEDLSESMQFKELFQELKSIQDKFVEVAAKNLVYDVNYKKAIVLCPVQTMTT
jgi:hypothetical protein